MQETPVSALLSLRSRLGLAVVSVAALALVVVGYNVYRKHH